MDLDLWKVGPDAFDASPGDLLTVVELNALQTMAALQVFQGHISDEGAVVQLHHGEALLAAGAAAQSSDAIVCDQLAVGQGQCLQARAVDRQLNQGVICYQNTFFQVHFFKLMTIPGQNSEPSISNMRASCSFKDLESGTVESHCSEGAISDVTAARHTKDL